MENNLPQKSLENQIQKQINNSSGLLTAIEMAKSKVHYKAHASRKNPAAIVIMIDQSGSMSQEIENGISKAQITADIVNSILQDTLMKCVKEDGLREYFKIMIFGYGDEVNNIWEGDLFNNDWVTIKDLQDNYKDIIKEESIKQTPFGPKKYSKEKYKWISARSDGKSTAMKKAFDHCISKLNDWVIEFENSFPPLVFNITDGQPTDIKNNFEIWKKSCEELKSICTKDGNTLLFNILLTNGEELILPSESDISFFNSNNFHKVMYESSSVLPFQLQDVAFRIFRNSKNNSDKIQKENTRCVIFNSSANSLLHLITVGTTTIHNNARE